MIVNPLPMEASSTYPEFSFFRFVCICLLAPLLIVSPGLMGEVHGQEKIYATLDVSSGVDVVGVLGPGDATVNNPSRASDHEDNAAAELVSTRVLAGILGAGDAWLQVKFPEQSGGSPDIPAKAATFFRIDAPTLTGISLDLGSLLNMANNIIPAELYYGSTSGSNGTAITGINVISKIVLGGDGSHYLMVYSPDNVTDYDGVRIKLTFSGLNVTVASNLHLNVYHAFTLDATPSCGVSSFADLGQASGVTVSIGDLVLNPGLAVDNDANTHSTITTGTLNLLGSIFQTFYFNGLSAPQDYFKIKFKIGGGSALDLNVLGNFEVRAYNGDQLVYTKKLQGALVNGLDLLTLLESGNPITVPFAPGVPFDRVAIGINTTVAVNLASSPLEVYHVERYGLNGSPLICVDPDPPLVDEGDNHMLGINRECADQLVGHQYVNFPFNAIDGDPGTYAVLEATSGSLLGLDAYSGNIEIGYPDNIQANTTSYLKIDMGNNGLLTALLDGSLGGLLGGTLDNLVFGDHYFDIQVNDENGDPVLNGSSANAFNGVPIRVVQDKYGAFYVAITPTTPYRSVKITEHFPALVGLEASRTMKVYSLCYSTGSEDCEQAFATYSESSGFDIDVLGIGNAGVTNAHLAIDDDDESVEEDETYSEIGLGAADIGASSFQFVEFHTLSNPADYFKVKLGVDGSSVIDINVLNNIEIRAYAGDELVYSQRIENGKLADIDVLGLLSTDDVVTIPIGPGKAFDRVAVGVTSTVGLGVFSAPLRLYSIKRFGAGCPDPRPIMTDPPTESPFNDPDCSIDLGAFEHVNFAYNAIDGNLDTYATISAGSGAIAGIGAYSGYLEMNFGTEVPAHETSYIRIDMADDRMLDALVGGSLGEFIADVGDLVLFGNHYFDVAVLDAGGDELYETSSIGDFANNNVRIVRDEFGRYYIAVTADLPYQSVRITLHNTALLGADASTTMNVYSMCRETVFDPCEQATFTSFDGTGLSASLLNGANPAGVTNPQYAIDGNNSNYAEFSLGTVGVNIAASLYQDIYFKAKVTTTATDKVRLRVQVPSSLLNVDLLGAYTVYLFNGEQQVGSPMTLQSGLINELDLLGLLNSGSVIGVDLEPGDGLTYDRVRFEISKTAGVAVGNPIRLYGVYRISDACPDPEFEQPPFEVCSDIIVDANEYVDDLQNLLDGNHNSYATIRSDAGLVGTFGSYSGTLELGYGSVVPTGTPSYIRIGYDEDILSTLLAGSLGDVVNDVLNGIALGDHYFEVIVKDENGTEVVSGSSNNLFEGADGQIALVQDTEGRYYLRINPAADYQSVQLIDHTTALLALGLSEGHLDVYGMCHTPNTAECVAAFSTSYSGDGLTADVFGVGGAGVRNAFWAIDQNTSNASTLSLGAAAIGGTIQQNVQFNEVVPANTPIRVKLQVGSGSLNVDALSTLEVIGYLNGVPQFTQNFNTAFVEADVLALLDGGTPAELTIEQDVSIDEIAIRLSSLATLGIAPNVSLYSVIPYCASFTNSYLTVTEDGAVADGVAYNEVTATVLDAGNNAIADQEVVFTIVKPDGTTTTQTVITDSEGIATLQITSTTAGEATISAAVEGMIISVVRTGPDPEDVTDAPAIVTFVAGPVDHGESTLEVTKDGAVANDADYNELIATVVDANGNPIEGKDVVFNVTYPDASSEPITISTDAEGKAVLQITSATAGDATVEATVDGTAISGSPATVTFVADIVDYDQSILEVTKDGAIADGVDYNELTATITDAGGNPVAGSTVIFGITYPDGTTDTETVVTGADGKAILPITSLTPGTANVTATVGGVPISGSPATVTFAPCTAQPTITYDGTLDICEGNGILLTSSTANGYQWYLDGNPIAGATTVTYMATEAGVYTVIVMGTGGCFSLPSAPATVVVNPAPEITINGDAEYAIGIGTSITLPDVAVDPASATVTWYDYEGTEIGTGLTAPAVGPFTEPGTYVYTIVAEDGDCSATASISIVVFDPDACPPGYERIYVNASNTPSGVTNPGGAVGSDLADRAEIAIPSLFGTNQLDLSFAEPLSGGEALHVKAGSRVNLSLIGGVTLTIQALNGGTPVGTPVSLSGGWLLNLLAGENQSDIVVPNPGATYDGVRVSVQGGLLAAGNIDVYAAYANREVAELTDCQEVVDILTGSTSGALGALNGVTNAPAATNDDMDDFATIRQNVNALGFVHLTALYSSTAKAGDSIRVIVKNPNGGLLDAGVLDGIWIDAYNGNTAVHSELVDASVLRIQLLPGSTDLNVISFASDAPFDRIQIRAGGVVGALSSLEVYHVERIAAIDIANPGLPGGVFEICQGADLVLDADDCGTVYDWYDNATGGAPIAAEGFTFTVPTDWAPGDYTVYVQPKRFGCDFGGRIPVNIRVLESPTAGDIVVESASDVYCFGDEAVLTATAPDFTDPQFTWYFDADKLEPVASGNGVTYTIDNGGLSIVGLAPGTYTYYVSVREGADGCENPAGELASIEITVDEIATEDDLTNIQVNGVDPTDPLCLLPTEEVVLSVELSPASTIENAVFHWYDASGTSVGTSADGTLNLGILTPGVYTYSVGLSGDDICESGVDDRKTVTFTINPVADADDIAEVSVNGVDGGEPLCLLPGETVVLEAVLTDASTITNPVFHWYDADGNLVAGGEDGELDLGALAPGDYTYRVGVSGDGLCETLESDRKSISFTINPNAGPDDIGDVTVVGADPDGNVCIDADGNVTLLAVLAEDSDLINPVFHWYDADGNPVPGGESGELVLTGFAPGTYTYYVGVSADGVCETPAVDRKSINFISRICTDLAIEKTVDNATPYVGDNLVFTIVVTNNGPGAATGVVVTDELPNGYTYVSSDATVGTFDAATNTWTVGSLANSASATLTITARVLAAGDYINYASVDGDEHDPDEDNNEDTPDDPVVPVPVTDLAIVKTVDNATPYVGDNVVFTIVATNNGPSDATGVAVTDELPSGYTYVSSDATVGTFDAATNTWTVGSLANGASATLTITAGVLAAGDYINYASVDGDEHDPDEDNNEDTPDDPVVPVPVTDLAIVKTVDNATPYVGDNVVFTIVATNNGPSDATGVAVTDELPSGYTYVSSDATAGTFDATTSTWTVGSLANGASATLTITARVLAAGDYINYASVDGDEHDPDEDNNEDTPDDPVVPVPVTDLAVVKTVDNATPYVGDNVVFTIVATNNGPSDATGVAVTDELPSGYTYVSSDATVGTFDAAANTWTVGSLANGASATLTITAEVLAAGDYINYASVDGDEHDPDEDNNEDTPDDPVVPIPVYELSVTKVADQDRVVAGETTTFTVTITNNGPSPIGSGETIRLAELPSEGMTITNYAIAAGNATIAGGANEATATTTDVVAVGGTIVVTISATVDADAPATITNGIQVWGPDKDPETDDPDDEDETPEIPVDRVSNMGITKVADQARVKAGTSTTFTLTVTNNGPSVIEVGKTIQLAERPGTGVTITGYEVTAGAATLAGAGNEAVLTTTGKITVGGTITVKVTADVDANAPTTITNGISVWGPDKDPGTDDPDDEDDTPEIPVDPNATLSITKVADQSRVKAGESTTFTLTITNEGPSSIANGEEISLSERPGEGVTITGYTISSGNATVNGTGNSATVTTTAAFPEGSTIVVKVAATIAGGAEGTITNGISVWGPDKDPGTDDPDDEDDTPEIPVDPSYTLSISKEADDETVISGGSTSFTVTITNNGPSTIATGKVINLEERPGAGITITGYEVTSSNATVSGTGNNPALTTSAAIPSSGTIVVVVSADVTAVAGSTIANGIAVWGPDKNPDTDEEDDEDETPEIPVERPYTLSIEKVGDQSIVTAGQPTTFTVTVTNNGPMAIEAGKDIALQERPGAGVTITGYEVISGAATVVGAGNQATIATTGAIDVGSTIVIRITADVAVTAAGTITNGITVWGPDRDPDTDDPDDEDDTNPIPVDATLVIPNLFTPNGDGLNDLFVIRNLLQYQGRELMVINRWGNQVYKSNNYNNDWDGGSLAEGTYYYILRVRNGNNGEWQTHKGAVAIIRVTGR